MKKNNFLTLFAIVAIVLGVASCNKLKKGDQSANDGNDTVAAVTSEPQKSAIATFNYTPQTPTDGKLKGVVELGASGFNLFIIEMDKDKNWMSKKKEFGNSMVTEKMTTPEEVKSTLQDYIKTIIDFGVASKDIHFVISSGAAKEDITQTITKALKEIGYVVNVVTPEEEAKYALKCVLPNAYKEKAFVVDMGSGNTKISYYQDNNLIGVETYGAKYYKKDVDNQVVYDEVKEKLSKVPSNNTHTCFLIGGVPYQMAKTSKLDKERYTVLSTNVDTYSELAAEKGDKVTCGLNIYKGILDGTNCQQVVFDWDANFTIGFLLSLAY